MVCVHLLVALVWALPSSAADIVEYINDLSSTFLRPTMLLISPLYVTPLYVIVVIEVLTNLCILSANVERPANFSLRFVM